MKELGISAGTFNPIHYWHLLAAQCCIDQFGLDKVLIIPNGQPPHKKNGVVDKMLRFEMATAACASNPKLEVSTIEIDRVGTSYTLDTLKQLKALYGNGVRLNFIIGLDNVVPMKTWYKADEVFALIRLLIAPRLLIDPQQVAEVTKNLPAHAVYEIVNTPTSTISSTLIREWVAAGRSIEYLVPPAVDAIIKREGLYKAVQAPVAPVTVVPSSNPAPVSPTTTGG